MFVAIVGTRFSGKTSVENYLVHSKGFTSVRLRFEENLAVDGLNGLSVVQPESELQPQADSKHASFTSISPISSPLVSEGHIGKIQTVDFYNIAEMLNYVTENWRRNFVTCDLSKRCLIEPFTRRPFFLVLRCDAPLMERYRRSVSAANSSLVDFVQEDDRLVFGTSNGNPRGSLQGMVDLVNITVTNTFPSLHTLHKHLDGLDLLDPEHLRPSWDSYFMTLAFLASRRSNCMKRRVGAILVRQNRVLATGYNGTPRGLPNCNAGGCSHCNYTDKSNLISNECLCLHAEENALLEAGRERVGADCVLYCNTCPCLKCTIKIIQTGVKTVVYNLAYKVDKKSARLFKEAGVELRRYDPNSKFHLLPSEDEGLTSTTSQPSPEF